MTLLHHSVAGAKTCKWTPSSTKLTPPRKVANNLMFKLKVGKDGGHPTDMQVPQEFMHVGEIARRSCKLSPSHSNAKFGLEWQCFAMRRPIKHLAQSDTQRSRDTQNTLASPHQGCSCIFLRLVCPSLFLHRISSPQKLEIERCLIWAPAGVLLGNDLPRLPLRRLQKNLRDSNRSARPGKARSKGNAAPFRPLCAKGTRAIEFVRPVLAAR